MNIHQINPENRRVVHVHHHHHEKKGRSLFSVLAQWVFILALLFGLYLVLMGIARNTRENFQKIQEYRRERSIGREMTIEENINYSEAIDRCTYTIDKR